MSIKIYLNGEFVDREKAVVSVFDHGLLYGDGCFEGIRAYDGYIFKLDEHIERLYESAKTIHLEIPLSIEEMKNLHIELLKINNLRDGYFRTVVTRGVGDLGLDPGKCKEPSIFIIADKIKLYPQIYYDNGLEVVTVSIRRTPPDSLNGRVKSLNYLNNIMAKMESGFHGAQEALMLNHSGQVVECSADNVFVVKGMDIYTSPIYLGALEGITRNSIMDIAESLGYKIKEVPFTVHDIYNSDEAFLTGTAAEIVSIVKLDKRQIGTGKPGPVYKRIREVFHDYVKNHGTQVY